LPNLRKEIKMSVTRILTSLGLGQGDLENVFGQTIERLRKIDITTGDMRKGQRQAIQTMMDVLRDEDVMTPDTKKRLETALDQAYKE